MAESLIDWGLAQRVSARVSGAASADRGASAGPLAAGALEASCVEAERLVRDYSRLDPAGSPPRPEPIGRAEWSRSVLATLRDLTDELQREHRLQVSLPGPLGGIARSALRLTTGTEVGLAAGYAARRVLGQYDVAIIGPDRPARLLFVAPNIAALATELDVQLEPFARWVALHETTHALQFAAAPWLREELARLVRELVAGAASGVGLSDLLRRLASDPRRAISGLLRGDLARAIAGPEQAPVLDRIQAAMTVVEGHAEHVMDAAAAEFVPGVGGLRERLELRRASRGPVETIVGRLLGLDLKLRQYELGKGFCDAVAAEGGTEMLHRVWDGPDSLPSTAELERPAEWLARIGTSEPATAR